MAQRRRRVDSARPAAFSGDSGSFSASRKSGPAAVSAPADAWDRVQEADCPKGIDEDVAVLLTAAALAAPALVLFRREPFLPFFGVCGEACVEITNFLLLFKLINLQFTPFREVTQAQNGKKRRLKRRSDAPRAIQGGLSCQNFPKASP